MDEKNFKSQALEDKFLYEKFFQYKRNGKYIELGAMDGVEYSNTYFFEKELGWNGILIEPNHHTFKLLEKNRPNNFLFNDLVSNQKTPLIYRYFENAMNAVSGVESSLSTHHFETYFDSEKFCKENLHESSNKNCFCWWKKLQPQGKISLIPKTFSEILKSTNIKEFDFLSLDVEGHEFEVLDSWDFSIPINVILIETLGVQEEKDNLCRKLLSEKNYTFYSKCAQNEIWIINNYSIPNNMKVMRLGFSEGSLLAYWYIHKKSKEKYVNNNIINWLLTTSGYYDNQINGSYFNFSNEECIKLFDSYIFNDYMENVFNGLKNCNLILICLLDHLSTNHKCDNFCKLKNNDYNIFTGACPLQYNSILNDLVLDLQPTKTGGCLQILDIHKLMENKKVLIISSFAKLMQQQVLSGNCSAIYTEFPKNVFIIPFQSEYTFFNKGNDNNILETIERYKNQIKNIEFDLAIVSCGAYTHLLVPFIADQLCKGAVTSFSTTITDAFGIISKRSIDMNKNINNFWIHIPDEFKPDDYLKIEEGCYW